MGGAPAEEEAGSPARPAADPHRLAAVATTRLLDTDAEESFDRISGLARQLLRVPFAFLTVVDEQRSFWKSRQGLPAEGPRQNALHESFCQYVVDSGEPLVLGDVRAEELTRDNPSIQSMGVVAWAGFPVHTPDGHVLGTLCVVDTAVREWTPEETAVLASLAEIASREVALRVAVVEAETARARAQLFARIGDLLVAGLDLPAVWSAVASLAVPGLGDFALTYSVERDGLLIPRAFAHSDPDCQAELSITSQALARSTSDANGPGYVAATGRTQVLHHVGALEDLSPGQQTVRDRLAVDCAVIVPLRARGELVGVLNVVRGADSASYTDADVELVEAIAARAALALDNALAYNLERNLSAYLQRALLPPLLPQPNHLQIVSRYRPAAGGQVVGGDWYDAYLDRSGITTVVIGDVAGHDIAAATTMGQLRTLTRVAGHPGTDTPARVLETVDDRTGALDGPVFATILLASIDRYDAATPARARRLTWSSAGHLPPLLLTGDGGVRLLETSPDPVIGLGSELINSLTPRRDHTATLPPSSTLLLYTDGLVERRGEDLDTGLERLVTAARALAHLDLEDLCDALIEQLDHHGDDDTALIAVRAFPEGVPRPAEAGGND